MKRLAALLVAICCITPVFAQSPDPVAVVAHVVELSSDQITAWSDILHARQAALQPLAEQAQAQQQAIAQAIAGPKGEPNRRRQSPRRRRSFNSTVRPAIATGSRQAASRCRR